MQGNEVGYFWISVGPWRGKICEIEQFWTWEKLDGLDTDVDAYLGADRYIAFEKDIWFELGKSMRNKYWSVFQEHVEYIHNIIVKLSSVDILQYAKRVREMHDLENYLLPPLMKGVGFKLAIWDVREK